MEEFADLDLGAVEQLGALKAQRDVLEGRLKTMEERKSAVSADVYARVQADYRAQLDQLLAQMAPLKEQARSVYRRVRAALDRIEQTERELKLAKEELDFRFSLGEFDERVHGERGRELDARLGECGSARERAQTLRERFRAVFESDEDLERAQIPAPAAAPASAPPPSATPAPSPAAPPAPSPSSAPEAPAGSQGPARYTIGPPPPMPSPAAAATVVAAPVPPPPAAVAAPSAPPPAVPEAPKRPVSADATMMFRPGRLSPEPADPMQPPVLLSLKPIVLGTDASCDVRIGLPNVARRQVEISMTRQGFVAKDLGGGVGLKVNGEAKREHLLRDGDQLDVGGARYTFRLG